MSDTDDPRGGMSSSTLPVTSVWAGGRKGAENVKLRSFEEIIQDAKSNRNILEIHLKKIVNENDTRQKNF